MNLKISNSLQLPLDFITERATIFGTSGSGKTYFAMKLVEEICRNKLPCVIIDVVGIWWGLRLSVDGESEGLPMLIAGETDRCDLRVSASKGKALAEVYMDTRQNMILDVSGWGLAEQCTFIADFLNELFVIHDRTPLMLVADEVHTYAPESTGGVREVKQSRDALVNWATKGRAKGLGLLNVTQRPALISNSVWGLSSSLITLSIPFKADLEKVAHWMSDKTSSPQEASTTAEAIRGLKPKEAFIASRLLDPDKSIYRFALTKADERTTYDSSATPKVGIARINPKPLSPELISSLETIVETGDEEEELVGQLRRRIAYLQSQLRSADAEKALKPNPEAIHSAIAGISRAVGELQNLANILATGLNEQPQAIAPQPAPEPEPEMSYSRDESLLLAAIARLQDEGVNQLQNVSLLSGVDSDKALRILEKLRASGVVSVDEGNWFTSERVEQAIEIPKVIGSWRERMGQNARSIVDAVAKNTKLMLGEADLAKASGAKAGKDFRAGLEQLKKIGFLLRIGNTYYLNPVLAESV